MTRRAAQGVVLLVAGLVAGGCQCSLDTSAIDDLRCETDEDCSDVPGTACSSEHYCQIVDGGPTDAAVDSGPIECEDPELAPCDGECVPLRSDPDHCGACDRECPGAQLCQDGDCVAACGGGRQNCGGACVDVLTDRLFCGDCETRCENADVCVQGTCRPCAGPTDCDDRIDCTVDDCGADGCTNVVADGQCVEGGLCVAAGQACAGGGVCVPCAGGCAVPPTEVTVSCSGEPAPGGAEASCNISTNQPTVAECLSCTFLAGMTELVRERFDDCDLQERDWIVSEDGPICPMQAVVFAGTDRLALEADEGAWSIERHVNTTDFDRVRLCFDTAERSDDNAHFLVSIDTGGGWVHILEEIDEILAPLQPAWITRCFDLHPLGGAGIADLGIRFYLDAANDKDLYLDNVFVDAWGSADLANVTVFADDFAGCLAAWTVEGEDPWCNLQGDQWGVEADRRALEAEELTSHVSVRIGSTFCEDPWLSFAYGHVNTDGGEQLTLELDTGDGWDLVWGNLLGLGPEDAFMPLAFGLAHLDDRARDGTIGVRFGLFATGANRSIAIDDVVVQGKTCGDAGERVTVPPIVTVGARTFSFALAATEQMTVLPVCTWGGDDAVSGRARVTFRY